MCQLNEQPAASLGIINESVHILWTCCRVSAWVDAVWDFEFTDTDPLDPVVEEEIKEDPGVFKTIYMQLLHFSNEDDDNTQV